MSNRILQFTMALSLAITTTGFAYAQSVNTSQRQINPSRLKMTNTEKARLQKEFLFKHPLLAKRKIIHPRMSYFPIAEQKVLNLTPKKDANNLLLANATAEIWVNYISSERNWPGPLGYYTFHPTNPLSFTSVYESEDREIAANGIQFTDGHIYGLNLDMTWATYSIYSEYLYDTDTNTGETSKETLSTYSDINLVATETAQADDGTVYGEFYNSDGSAFEWGTVDYATKTRTTIGKATNTYVALGITKSGQLYGVATDGNLYKIDKATGVETLVGPTGLTIAQSDGSYYAQTGEIDQKDNTFYWAAIDKNQNGGLYEVNLETGAATLIASNSDQLYGMYIPSPAAENGAPAEAKDLSLNFQGTSLSGTITFTAPTKTYGGDELTGDLTYTVKANDQTVATGTTQAGQTVTANITVPASGDYNFVVTTSNSIGESPKAKENEWIGYDQPVPPYDVTVTKNDNSVTVTWDAPFRGEHYGTIGDLTYDVYRISANDTVKVASDLTTTTYTDDLVNTSLGNYIYGVIAKSEGLSSDIATSDGIVIGDAIEPDWTETFNSEEEFDLFTVLDANNDGRTWNYTSYNNQVQSNYSTSNGNDDWLFTPPIHLTPGRLYTVTFKVRNGNLSWPNTFEAKWGNDTTAAAMTNTLVETYTPSDQDTVISVDINPATDGKYYIGFHDNTAKANQFYLIIDSIAVTKGAIGVAPSAVTDLTVTPGARGDMSATLSFNAPSKDVNGSNIAHIDSFVISRDNVKIATLPDANAGESLTYVDNNVTTNGSHTYGVTPYIGENFGQTVSATAFIGQDIPTTPQNFALLDNTDDILAKWNAFSEIGANGGYVDPTKVAVSFFNVGQDYLGYTVEDSIVTSEKGATSQVISKDPEQSIAEDGKSQSFYRVAVRADGDKGSSSYLIADPIIVGPSINLPFKESFAGGKIENGFAWISGNEQFNGNSNAASWIIDTQNTGDGDGGSASWHAYTETNEYFSTDYTVTPGDEVSLNSPKISLRGATKPVVYFRLYATANDPAKLDISIQTPDGVNQKIKTYDLQTTTTTGWTTQGIDLSQFASQRFIIVRFNGIALGEDANIGLDNINVFDQLEYNLRAAGINVPEKVTAGKSDKVDVYVENYGANTVSDYSVVLYSNDKAVDTVSVTKGLPVLGRDTVSLSLPIVANQTGEVSVKAKVVLENDLNEEDNTTEAKTVTVVPSEYTKVEDLKATTSASESGKVDLNWSKPAFGTPVDTTEDFESYEPFSTDLGDWTLVDGDHGLAGRFLDGYSYPGQGTAFAFDAFNPNAITSAFNVIDNNPGLAPHSGSQFAGAPYAFDPATGDASVNADNWIISPGLSGNAQTITFYAFNIATSGHPYSEKFDVLYSNTDKEISSFIKIESDVADGVNDINNAPNWKKITVQIPEGAKYFAIHQNTESDDNFLFGIDDITYQKGFLGASDSIVAYNIYRDGELIGTVDGDKTSFTDDSADEGNHVYNITVVYQDKAGNRNESGFSNDASVTVVTGIDSIHADKEGNYNVYTIDGKTVMLNSKTLNGLKSGVYIINDKKYIIK